MSDNAQQKQEHTENTQDATQDKRPSNKPSNRDLWLGKNVNWSNSDNGKIFTRQTDYPANGRITSRQVNGYNP